MTLPDTSQVYFDGVNFQHLSSENALKVLEFIVCPSAACGKKKQVSSFNICKQL